MRIQQEFQQASAAGDIATIVKIIQQTSKLPVQDFIKKTCGSLLYVYYAYIKFFRLRPVDINDLVDGLLYIEAYNYQIKDQTSGTKT